LPKKDLEHMQKIVDYMKKNHTKGMTKTEICTGASVPHCNIDRLVRTLLAAHKIEFAGMQGHSKLYQIAE
jgi:triosephosphate isomerase